MENDAHSIIAPNPTLPQTTSNPHKVLILVSAFVFSLLLCLTSIYLYLQNQKLSKQVSQLKLAQNIIPTPEPTPILTKMSIQIDTTTWKTYKNITSMFFLKLPTDAFIEEIGGGTPPFSEEYLSRSQDIKLKSKGDKDLLIISTGQISTGVLKDTVEKYYNDLLQEAEKLSIVEPVKRIEFLGHDAYSYTVKSSFMKLQSTEGVTDSDNDSEYRYLWFDNNSTRFSIIITHEPESEIILSTFKFSDQPSESKYKCPKNGWVNCMPSIGTNNTDECSSEAMSWYKKNCSNFQGGAM